MNRFKYSAQLFLFIGYFLALSKAFCPRSAVDGSVEGSCYFVVNFNESFQKARAFCQDFYGDLASIPKEEDNTKILEMARRLCGDVKEIWLGGTLEGKNFTWLDGSPVTFNNLEASTASGNLVMKLETGKWSTATWNKLLPFVCIQKEGVTVTPSIGSPITRPTTLPSVRPTTMPTTVSSTLPTTVPQPPPTCPACPKCPLYPPCPNEWTYAESVKMCYKPIYNVDITNADISCRSMGGSVVSIHSAEENRVVAVLLKSGNWFDKPPNGGLLGGRRTGGGAGDFVWLDGTPWDYTNWAQGEPSNKDGQEGCVEIYPDVATFAKNPQGDLLKWNDETCSETFRAALCKQAAKY